MPNGISIVDKFNFPVIRSAMRKIMALQILLKTQLIAQ